MFSKILATKSSILTKKLPFITFLPRFFSNAQKNSKPQRLEFNGYNFPDKKKACP